MKKFTFISEFRGGTYISQFTASSVTDALRLWITSLDESIYSKGIIDELKKDIQEEIPTPLDGIENVWCCAFTAYDSFLLLNIIETV